MGGKGKPNLFILFSVLLFKKVARATKALYAPGCIVLLPTDSFAKKILRAHGRNKMRLAARRQMLEERTQSGGLRALRGRWNGELARWRAEGRRSNETPLGLTARVKGTGRRREMDSRLIWALRGLASAECFLPNGWPRREGRWDFGPAPVAPDWGPRASQTPGTGNSALASQIAGDQGGLDVLGLASHFICEPGNACYPTGSSPQWRGESPPPQLLTAGRECPWKYKRRKADFFFRFPKMKWISKT